MSSTTSRISKFILDNVHFLGLLGIIIVGVWIRSMGWNPDVILDFDPWWFFRHAQEILNNNFVPPTWNILSFYPPGRPVDYALGWPYTMAVFYAMVKVFIPMTFTKFAGIFVAVFASLSAIPAYFVGKHITNKWGGLVTAFFSVITVTFVSVSIAGYTDSDAVNVFYSFLAIATTFFAIKKANKMNFGNYHVFLRSLVRYLPYAAPALISYWLFAFSWNSSWYIYYIFLLFIPVLIVFRILESVIRREHKFGVRFIVSKIRENRNLIFAILFIGLAGELISVLTSGWPFNIFPPHAQLVSGLNILGTSGIALAGFVSIFGLLGAMIGVAFGRLRELLIGAAIGVIISIFLIMSGITGDVLLVNQSVAELQPIQNVFSGFGSISERIGAVPVFFAMLVFVVTFLKFVFKKKIHNAEYFVIIWFIISLFLITKGVRFSLLFSMAIATAAGITIGNMIMYAKDRKGDSNIKFLMFGSIFALVVVAGILHFNDNYGVGLQIRAGTDVNQNFMNGFDWLENNADKDALIATWWDPGHIIAGTTGLKTMADGAHCGGGSCIFLNHDIRIQDMGRAFSISSEEESVDILRKYMSITPEQCQQVQQKFPGLFTPESCRPVSDMYVLATSDLIGKYYWLSFFGMGQQNVFNQCSMNEQETARLGAPTYVCSGAPVEISLVQQENTVLAVMNSPSQGIRNVPIKDLILFQEGQQIIFSADLNNTNIIDGLVWTDPSFRSMVFMQKSVRDSIFTNMFFFEGRGNPQIGIKPLEKYKIVYANPEMKIFKVDFSS